MIHGKSGVLLRGPLMSLGVFIHLRGKFGEDLLSAGTVLGDEEFSSEQHKAPGLKKHPSSRI